jgi:hypothetical protein
MTQAVVNSFAYDLFGTVLNQQETATQPFKYSANLGLWQIRPDSALPALFQTR